MKALPPFFCAAIAPHLHGSTGDTKGVIFPTSQFYFRAAGWLGGGGGCDAEGRLGLAAWPHRKFRINKLKASQQ